MTKPKRQIAPVRASWQALDVQGARLPGFWGHTLGLHEGKLYLIGGIATPGESRAQAGEELITVDTTNWVCTRKFTTGAGPEFTDSHAAVIAATGAGPRLYTFGGTDGGHKFNELHELDFETYNWTLPSVHGTPPVPRESHTATLVGSQMVVFGGHGDPGDEPAKGPTTALSEPYLNDITVFDVNTHTWHTPDVQGAQPPVRDSHAAVALGNRMVIYGGDCGKEYLSDVWAYDVLQQRWQAFKNKSGKEPGTRAGPVMVAVEAGLLMFGGVASGDIPFAPECWLLQLGPSPLLGLKENEAWWSELVTDGGAPPGRFAHAAAGAGETMYMVGGYAQDEKPLSDVWMLSIAAPVPVAAPKEPKSHKKKESIGMKMITSYNLFCEHRRPEVRQANPNIVPREVESIIGSMWKDMTSEDKQLWKQKATEQNNRLAAEMHQLHAQQGGDMAGLPILVSNLTAQMMASKKRDPRLDGFPESAGPSMSSQYLPSLDGSKRQRTDAAPNCTIYIPNPSLIGAQVDGKVTGSFQSGYLAEVAVNGFTYHAVLFSPYLALATPSGLYPQMAHNTKSPAQHAADESGPLPVMPEESGILGSTTIDTKAEDVAHQAMDAPSGVDFAVAAGHSAGPE
ncbi:TPA: hypothetical protein ACH3X1_014205 [Trebouxia sp. C0004]